MFARKTQKPHSAEGARNESEVIIQESLSWEASRTHLLEKSEQRAWVIARTGLGIAIAALLCLAAMIPFYKVIPVVFKVDNLTGEILEMQTDKAALPQSEKMDKYLLSQYVQLRERYVWTLLDNDYNTVIALSDTNVGKDYSAIYTGENALDKKLGPNTDIRVTLIAVAIISAPTPQVQASQAQTGKAQVTWERTMRQNGSDVEVKKRFISTISYGYTNNQVINLKQQLFANPFGFQVDGYAVSSVVTVNDDKPDTASRNSTRN